MDPSKDIDLLSSSEIPNNSKSDAINAPYPLWFQSFPRQNMYQSNHQLYPLQYAVIRPPNCFPTSPNYNIVNSLSAQRQRPCSFPPQQHAQNGRLPYYTAPGVFRQPVPNPTLKAGILNKTWKDNKVLKTLAKPQSVVQSTVANGDSTRPKTQIANKFCSRLYNYQETQDACEKRFSEKHDPTNRSYKPQCSNDVTPAPSVCCDRNGNEISQLTSDVKRHHPYSRKTAVSESDSAWSKKSENRSPDMHCQNVFPTVQRSPESNIIKTKDKHVERSEILQESPSKLEYKYQYDNETETTSLFKSECSGYFKYTTNVRRTETQEELSPMENETEQFYQKNAEELLLSMANRRIKINRLLEEQKRLMANLNVMKTGTQENSHQHGTER